jgi:uncharacterized protein YbcI
VKSNVAEASGSAYAMQHNIVTEAEYHLSAKSRHNPKIRSIRVRVKKEAIPKNRDGLLTNPLNSQLTQMLYTAEKEKNGFSPINVIRR